MRTSVDHGSSVHMVPLFIGKPSGEPTRTLCDLQRRSPRLQEWAFSPLRACDDPRLWVRLDLTSIIFLLCSSERVIGLDDPPWSVFCVYRAAHTARDHAYA